MTQEDILGEKKWNLSERGFGLRVSSNWPLFLCNAHAPDPPQCPGLQPLKVAYAEEVAAAISKWGLSIKPARPNACQTGSARRTTSLAAVEWDL